MRVADYIADFLAKNSIRHCFSVTGGGAMHLNDALGNHKKLHSIYNHHEQASAMAAEAYTRFSGRLAAVCVTSGPGGTNAITGVFGAFVDSIPMFILSGQAKRETLKKSYPQLTLRQLGDQECDITEMVKGITKYAVTVWDPLDIAYHLEKALHLATSGRGGPVWLDLPLDVQGADISPEALRHFSPNEEVLSPVHAPSPQTAREILDRIKKADAPLILVGTGVRLSHAENEVLAFIEALNLPVVVAWNAGDLIPFDHPLFAGMVGTVGTRAGNFALQSCDLLLSLGCRLNIRTVGYNRHDFAKNAYKIVVDIDENELKKPTVCADMPVHADVLALISALLKEPLEGRSQHIPWLQWCRQVQARYPSALSEYKKGKNEPINPYTFLDFLFSHLVEGDRIICSNGSACVMTFQAAKIKHGQRMFTNSGCAAMGYGLPASIGVAVADNSTRTLCIEGDGSIMMNLQELATVTKNKLNIKIILLNNNGYHSIRQTQKGLFQSRFVGLDEESGLGFPDFKEIATAFGLSYHKICGECDLAALDTALGGEKACLVEVVVDPTQDFAPKCATKRGHDGTLSSPSLDDMKPFLPRDEYTATHYKKS